MAELAAHRRARRDNELAPSLRSATAGTYCKGTTAAAWRPGAKLSKTTGIAKTAKVAGPMVNTETFGTDNLGGTTRIPHEVCQGYQERHTTSTHPQQPIRRAVATGFCAHTEGERYA